MSTIIKEIKVIKTEEQYYDYLNQLDELMAITPPLKSKDSDNLELLTLVLENYESKLLSIELPDPIEAIKFRMEEQGLMQADLVPYFGRASRVSEVFSGKRSLTIDMIRNVSEGLGISYEVLIGTPISQPKKQNISWSKFPINEMMKRGWISSVLDKKSQEVTDAIKEFVEGTIVGSNGTAFRRSLRGDAVSVTRQYATYAWLAFIIQKSREKRDEMPIFDKNSISLSYLRDLAKLSTLDDGPLKAVDSLRKIGISVVFEPRIEKTLLDGAALLDTDGRPVIGITLRYDRVDNFWFTLLHEVVHVWKHLDNSDQAIVDNLNSPSEDRQEAEANRLAREAMVPRVKWKRSKAYLNPSHENIATLAKDLGIHHAIVAGRLQFDKRDYTLFSELTKYPVAYLFQERSKV